MYKKSEAAATTATTPETLRKDSDNVAKKQVVISVISMLILIYIQIAVL